MASKGKKKTTMAKLNRERALHEKRVQKQVKKELRKRAAAEEETGAVSDPDPDPLYSAVPDPR
jgi:hypothetical protein